MSNLILAKTRNTSAAELWYRVLVNCDLSFAEVSHERTECQNASRSTAASLS